MPRTVSLTFRRAMYSQETGEVPILLITVIPDVTEHPAGPRYYFSSDPTTRMSDVPLVYGTFSRGRWYYYLPFSAILPDDKNDTPPVARIVMDNIDRELIRMLRESIRPATFQMELVMSSTPGVVEIDFPDVEMVTADYDANSIQLTLELNQLAHEPAPAGTFNPSGFPGLFE